MKRSFKSFSVLLVAVLVILCFAPMAQAAQNTAIKVSVMVIGDSRHAAGAHSQYQVWLGKTTYTMTNGGKAVDLIFMALDDNALDYTTGAGEYISSITAPAAWGGYALSEGTHGNGSGAGWMVSSDVSGYHALTEKGIGEHELSDGEFIIVHYVDDYTEIDWSTFPTRVPSWWLNAAPLPVDASDSDDSGSRESYGGGSGHGAAELPVTPREYGFSDLKKRDGSNIYQLFVEKGSTVKAGAFSGLPGGAVLYLDTVSGGRVQFRISFPSPSDIKSDLKSGMGFVPETNAVQTLFNEYFRNDLCVFAFDHTAAWGQTAEILIYAENIVGFDSAIWKLYSYDAASNSYSELSYRLGKDGYIRFFAPNGNPLIFSNGVLQRK